MAPPRLLLCLLLALRSRTAPVAAGPGRERGADAGIVGAERAAHLHPSAEPWQPRDGARVWSFPEPLQHLVRGPSWRLTGAEAAMGTGAAKRPRLPQRSLWAGAAALALLLLALLASCILISRLRHQKSRAGEAAPGDAAGTHGSKEQGMDNGEEPAHGMLSAGSFAAELVHAYRLRGTEPLPACSKRSISDGAAEPWISLDSPQPEPFWCPCHQFQQGYCTSEEESCWEQE